MSDNFRFAQLQNFSLAGSGAIAGATTITLKSMLDIDGTALTMSGTFGTIGYGTLEPGNGDLEEQISFTGLVNNSNGTTTLTGVKNVSFTYPYTETSGLSKTHAGSTTFVISNTSGYYNQFPAKNNDETITNQWNFTLLPTSDGGNATDPTQLITYAQALALATGTASINRVVVAGTAGATITIGQTVYLDDVTNTWKLTDADTPATVNNVIKGIAQGAGTSGNPITNGVLLFGLDSNQSGLTPGATYYFGNTAGAISATPGTTEVTAGQAASATTIIFYSQFNQQITEDQQDALVGASGTPNATNKYETENDTTNAATKTATTIAFVNSNPDTITDSGNGFVTAGFLEGQTITVTGSASNNGTFTIATVAAGTITLVSGDSLVAESAGATVTITAATANKLLRLNSSSKIPAVDGSNLTNVQATSLSKQVTSGENIAAGVPAWIYNADSKAYTSHGFKELDSTTLNLSAAPSTSHKTAKLSDTQMMYLTDNGTTTLTINVFDINSAASVATQTVTTAFDQTLDSTPTLPSATMCRLSDTTFVVFYAHTGDNSLYFRTGTISGGTITMDTETAYPGSPNYCYGMTAVPGASDGKVVLTYFDMTGELGSGFDSAQTLSYLTVATNSVTVTTTVSYTLSSGGFNVTPQWSNCCFTNGIAYGLFSCKNSAQVVEVSYNYININNSVTASNQYTLNLESPTAASVYGVIIPSLVGHNGKAYTGWATQNSTTDVVNTKTVLELTQVGCKIAYQNTTVRLNGDNSQFALRMFGNECGVIVSGFDDSVAGGYFNGSIYIQKDKIYGFYSGNTLGIRSNIPQAQAWYINAKDEVVVCYLDNSANGYIKQWKIPTPSAGLVTTAVTAPATATIWLNTATTSGLTANSPYFLKDTYTTIGDMSNTGTIPVGQALSTTVMDLS